MWCMKVNAGLTIMMFVGVGYPCISFVASNKAASIVAFCALCLLQRFVLFIFAS
jgi:hypothetical protein